MNNFKKCSTTLCTTVVCRNSCLVDKLIYMSGRKRKFSSESLNQEPAVLEQSTSENKNKSFTPKNGESTARKQKPIFGPPSQVFLQVIENGSSGYGKCIHMFTDQNRYLFNCPEDIGRITRMIPNFKFNRLQDVFITQKSWSNVGGLPGLGITLNQARVDRVTTHGPESIDTVFKATNCVYDGQPPVEIVQKNYDLGTFEDECIIIKYIPLLGENRTSYTLLRAESNEQPKKITVAYICRLKQRPGRMDILKCAKLGIPLGPLLGQLQKGQDVTLPNGRIVKPIEVMEEPERATCFALVDITDEEMLHSLLQSTEFDEFFQHKETDRSNEPLDLLIHYTDASIFQSTLYREWMRNFGSTTQHLVVNELAPGFSHNKGVHKLQFQMNHVIPQCFPLLRCHAAEQDYSSFDLQQQFVKAEPYLTYHLRPHNKFVRDDNLHLSDERETCVKTMFEESEKFEPALEQYRQNVAQIERSGSTAFHCEDYPEVVFLGTASAISTKYRNVSGILVNLNEHHSILMDCGEGTYRQMYEYFDEECLNRTLSNIKLIFISHLHADHHMGLFTLLLKRREAFQRQHLNYEPVYIVAPADLFKIHFMYSKYVEDVMPLARRVPSNGENHLTNGKLVEIRQRLNLNLLNVVKVMHPKNAFGLVLKTSEDFKLVYSGDTLESSRLIAAGRHADLLIHEATLDDSRVADAKKKYHCTIGQAIEICKKMEAKFSILTHISGRYPTMPLATDEQIEECGENICFAFDFMRYTPRFGKHLALATPVWRAAFERHLTHAFAKKYLYEMRLMRLRDEKMREMKEKERLLLASAGNG